MLLHLSLVLRGDLLGRVFDSLAAVTVVATSALSLLLVGLTLAGRA